MRRAAQRERPCETTLCAHRAHAKRAGCTLKAGAALGRAHMRSEGAAKASRLLRAREDPAAKHTSTSAVPAGDG